MDTSLVVLKLILDELGLSSEIRTIEDRKRVQKGIYLAQLSGIDLGYRFGWYLMGPYSPVLTRDYYSLAESIALGDRDWEGQTLRQSVKGRVSRIKPLLAIPEQVGLSHTEWLELVASLHYLRKIRRLGMTEARGVLYSEKANLAPYADVAAWQLKALDLLADDE